MLHSVLVKKAVYIKKRYGHKVCGGDTKRASDCVHLQEKEMEKKSQKSIKFKISPHLFVISIAFEQEGRMFFYRYISCIVTNGLRPQICVN